ncbi:hypothetical protein AB1Y20_011300 [Prymnesium parvum]|uniref:Uncharacterized protein n=1 Tax=Prymnesium parvum TaxID=97485 RepID=A0AB34IP54_PRYPA
MQTAQAGRGCGASACHPQLSRHGALEGGAAAARDHLPLAANLCFAAGASLRGREAGSSCALGVATRGGGAALGGAGGVRRVDAAGTVARGEPRGGGRKACGCTGW